LTQSVRWIPLSEAGDHFQEWVTGQGSAGKFEIDEVQLGKG
jgi:hypothetical protein